MTTSRSPTLGWVLSRANASVADGKAPSGWRGTSQRRAGAPRAIVYLGRPGPPMLAFARSCVSAGFAVHLLDLSDGPAAWSSYSRSLAGGRPFAPALIETPQGLAEIVRYVREIGAEGLITLQDEHQRWLAANRSAFEPSCSLLMPRVATLDRLSSKAMQIEIARSAGFDVLPTWLLTGPTDSDRIPPEAFPIVLRPDHNLAVRPDFKVRHVASRVELDRLLGELQFLGPPVIAQPFKSWPNLLVHGVRSARHGMLAVRSFMVSRKFEGLALTVASCDFPPGLEQRCKRFVETADLESCFHFDLLYAPAERKAFFLEINTRLGGTSDKVTRLGFDEGLLTLAAHDLAAARPRREAPCGGRVVNKRQVLKHLVHALKGPLGPLDYPGGSRTRHVLSSAMDLVLTRDSVFAWSDLRGSRWFHLRRASHP